MRGSQEILEILPALDTSPADHLEDQELDFKEWNPKSLKWQSVWQMDAAVLWFSECASFEKDIKMSYLPEKVKYARYEYQRK